MASVTRNELFRWQDIENLGDLERLRMIIDELPDEGLMRSLEVERGNGRDDYPIRAVWNSVLAGIIFEHRGIASLRRELLRNAQLRQVCRRAAKKGSSADFVDPTHPMAQLRGSTEGDLLATTCPQRNYLSDACG